MGIMRMDNADDTAKTALSIARSGDTDALSKFMKEVTTDRVSSLVQEPGQMALLVKEYAKQESAADRQILPQLVLAADGKDISVVAAKVAPDNDVQAVEQNIANLDKSVSSLDQTFGSISTRTPGFDKSIWPNCDVAEKAIQGIRNTLVANEESLIQAQLPAQTF
jgi:hypothetical protein